MLEVNGTDYELNVCMEECAELIQAISKCHRYGCKRENREHLIEEIADVTIIIKMLQVIYGISSEEIEEMIDSKHNREINRMALKASSAV